MARSPVTRAQVDAYRFGLRRMDAALIRRDPVPLHEEIRGQRRTVTAGVVVALIALAAAAVYGVVVPRPVWQQQSLVVGRQSGALYVVAHGPDRLVPVANLAAARLVQAAIGAAPGSDRPAAPEPLDDADLVTAPRTATAAVSGAPSVLPGAGSGIPPRWAVCDEVVTEPGRPTALAGTTVVAGVAPVGEELGRGRAVLLRSTGGQVYLVHDGKRHRLEQSDRRVGIAFDLGGRQPRPASDGLLAAIPEALPLAAPRVVGAGLPAPGGLPGRVGGVVRVPRPGAAERYYALLADGVQELPRPLAELMSVTDLADAPAVRQDQLVALPPPRVPLDVGGLPTEPLRLHEPAEATATCWASAEVQGRQVGVIVVGQRSPMPEGLTATRLAQADGAGPRLDSVYVAPGHGGAVRGAVQDQPSDTGALWLISDTGVAYGVPDAESAAALGITAATPAPEAVLRLLPTGPPLDLAAARRTVDVLEAAPG